MASGNVTDIEDLHRNAVLNRKMTYIDPETGFTVFTELAHKSRGSCCGNKCRHCPYGWENVRHRDNVQYDSDSDDGDDDMVKDSCDSYCSFDEEDKKEECSIQRKSIESVADEKCEKLNVPYTRKGDKGSAQLFTGERRDKSDPIFEALGAVDELCSFVGVVHAEMAQKALASNNEDNTIDYGPHFEEQLLDIMSRLFDLGSCIATPKKNNKVTAKSRLVSFDAKHVEDLEHWIDEYTQQLPVLRNFILPTGGRASAHLHVARTVCRRAERQTAAIMTKSYSECVYEPTTSEIALKYLNRLSDYLFTAARWTNFCEKRVEIVYRRPNTSDKQRLRYTKNMSGS